MAKHQLKSSKSRTIQNQVNQGNHENEGNREYIVKIYTKHE